VDLLGISDIAAAGVSSVPRADGLFDNRTFFYLPRGRHGLLEALGGEPGPFRTASLAPRDADLLFETEFDLARAYRAIRAGVGEVLGAGSDVGLDALVEQTIAPVGGVSVRNIIEHAHGRFSVIVRLDDEKTASLELDVPIRVPACDLLVQVEGIGRTLAPLLDEIPVLELSIRDGRRHYAVVGRPWVSTWTPAIVLDRDVAYFGSSQAFILACIERKDALGTDPAFVAALAELGSEGNSLTWVSPRLSGLRQRIVDMNEGSRSTHLSDLRAYLPVECGPVVTIPLVSVRRNLADGVLYRSRWDTSLKQDVFSATLLNPVTLAMSASILQPHYLKARERSQELAIYSNLRRLQVAAREYCYDRKLTTIPIWRIMGDEPGKPVPKLKSIAGEDYSGLVFREAYPLSVTTEDGRVVEYGP